MRTSPSAPIDAATTRAAASSRLVDSACTLASTSCNSAPRPAKSTCSRVLASTWAGPGNASDSIRAARVTSPLSPCTRRSAVSVMPVADWRWPLRASCQWTSPFSTTTPCTTSAASPAPRASSSLTPPPRPVAVRTRSTMSPQAVRPSACTDSARRGASSATWSTRTSRSSNGRSCTATRRSSACSIGASPKPSRADRETGPVDTAMRGHSATDSAPSRRSSRPVCRRTSSTMRGL